MTLIERLQRDGIRRLGSKERGFRYLTADGKRPSAVGLERVKGLKIPPAWTDVRIAPRAGAHLQAIGKDAKGRWQSRYEESFVAKQGEKKYERLIAFAEALPGLRRTIDRDLHERGLTRRRVCAAILRIISGCFIRPGSQEYADENGSYGIATLRPKHVKLRGDLIVFDFPGKSGKPQHRELRSRRVAQVIRECLRVKTRDVFVFRDEAGAVVDIRRRHINGYVKEVMGAAFSAKDFRTWAGTLVCACALARAGFHPHDGPRARKRKVNEAVKETAHVLGNTPAVCKSSYIFPSILSGYERGHVLDTYARSADELSEHRGSCLHACEKALLAMLRREHAPAAVAARRRRAAPVPVRRLLERSLAAARKGKGRAISAHLPRGRAGSAHLRPSRARKRPK